MRKAERLKKIIKRDTGIDVEIPVSINRGYWSSYDGCYRWQALEIGGDKRVFVSEDSITNCLKFGLEPSPRKPFYVHREWFFDRKSA